jgi:hypothetical protein
LIDVLSGESVVLSFDSVIFRSIRFVSSDITALNLLGIHSTFRTRSASKPEKLANILSRLAFLHLSTIEISDPTGIR